MKSRYSCLIIALLFIPALTFAQGKKTLKHNKISSTTTYEYFLEEGKKDPLVESIEVYDLEGNIIELKEFNSDGVIKNWQKFKYDAEENKIEEILLNEKEKVVERVVWVYKEGLVTEKLYYDQKDRLTKRKEYKYEYHLK